MTNIVTAHGNSKIPADKGDRVSKANWQFPHFTQTMAGHFAQMNPRRPQELPP
jgi:hypothetical protein